VFGFVREEYEKTLRTTGLDFINLNLTGNCGFLSCRCFLPVSSDRATSELSAGLSIAPTTSCHVLLLFDRKMPSSYPNKIV